MAHPDSTHDQQKHVAPTTATVNAVGVDLASVLPQSDKPWFMQKHLLHLNGLLLFVIMTPASLGFDASMMNGLQALQTWQNSFGVPTGALLGLFNAVMPLGTIVGSIPAGITSDRIGRKYTLIIGMCILILAAIMQSCAHNNATFIIARFFVGLGIEFAATPAPVLISELAYPTHRGKVTSLYQTFFYLGAIASSWITFGTFHMATSTWSWRIPSLLQAFFPVVQLAGLFWVPESPRWLISKGRTAEARAIFTKYHSNGDDHAPLVDYEMSEITSHIEAEKAVAGMGWLSLIKTPADRKRLAVCIFVAFISNWSGNGIITYYLNLVLEAAGITSSFTKTLINGILQIFNFGAAILGASLVDRAGRRPLWLVSCAGMLVSYIILTALQANVVKDPANKSLGIGVIVMLFVYFFHYDIAVTPLTFAYPVEIFPFHARQKGMAVVMLFNGVCGMINTFANPVALENMGWKYYIVYIVFLVIMFVFVYLFFPETKGHSLEEIADIFEGPFIVAKQSRRGPQPGIVEQGGVKCGEAQMVEDATKAPETTVYGH